MRSMDEEGLGRIMQQIPITTHQSVGAALTSFMFLAMYNSGSENQKKVMRETLTLIKQEIVGGGIQQLEAIFTLDPKQKETLLTAFELNADRMLDTLLAKMDEAD